MKTPGKGTFGALLAAATLGCTLALASSPAIGQQMKFFRIASGAAGGTYFPMAGMLANAISNPPGSRACDKGGSCGVPGLIAVAQSANGSVANVNGIQSGAIESGFSQSDVAYWAYTGTGTFAGKPALKKLRVIANLFPEHVHVVARKDAPYNTVSDLRGKRISIGLQASGAKVGAMLVLDAHGMKENVDFKAEYLNTAQSMDRLRDNQLDGMVTVSGYPSSGISEMFSTAGGRLLSIGKAERDSIIAKAPFYSHGVIPAGTYKGFDKDA
jgi:TRAP transporter TAXI family solute receptor